MSEIVHGISLCFSIPKRPYISLECGQEQNILGHSFERRAFQFILEATKVFPIRLYSRTGRIDRNLNILLMININPIFTR